MIFYLCQSEFGPCLAGTQADAKVLDRKFVQVDVPTDKQGLMDFINCLYLKIGIHPPEGQVSDFIDDSENRPTPFMSQTQVDKMFEPTERTSKLTPDDVDQVCILIEGMRGAAIGHVAHSLAARIERLAKGVQA